jgi:hypothetical protein
VGAWTSDIKDSSTHRSKDLDTIRECEKLGPAERTLRTEHARFSWVYFSGRETDRMKKLYAVVVSMLLFAGSLPGQQWTDWINAANSPDIQYRVEVFDRAKACDLEYRDQKQGTGYTTFDVDVDYKSAELNSDKRPTTKTDSEHIVTAPSHTGSSRISDCSAIVEARVSFVQRH